MAPRPPLTVKRLMDTALVSEAGNPRPPVVIGAAALSALDKLGLLQ